MSENSSTHTFDDEGQFFKFDLELEILEVKCHHRVKYVGEFDLNNFGLESAFHSNLHTTEYQTFWKIFIGTSPRIQHRDYYYKVDSYITGGT